MAEAHGDEAEETTGGQEQEQGLIEATLAYIARALVDHPEDVRVSSTPDDRGLVVRLDFNPEDAGRVIGRGGRIARSIRSVVKAAAAREGVMVHVQIGEPRRSDAEQETSGEEASPTDQDG